MNPEAILRTARWGLWCAAVVAVQVGCNYPSQGKPLKRVAAGLGLAPVDEAYDTPVMRMGSMPFNAWYSPFSPLDVEDLGDHHYMDVPVVVGGNRIGETSRGILYTERGGFIDISHTRNAIDLTRFVYGYVVAGFYFGKSEIELLSAEPDVYHLTLNAPPQWSDLSTRDDPEAEKALVEIHEASIQIAGRVAYLMTTWHEVLTWFGYKGMGVITEKPSAFSYDDAASHRVGVEAAMRALRSDPDLEHFNANVTASLHDYLIELGVVSADRCEELMKQMEGKWWEGDEPTLRVVDLGQDGQPLMAHVVDESADPVRWDWNPTSIEDGRVINDLFDVTIGLNVLERGKILEAMGKEEGPVHPRTDFPALHKTLEEHPLPGG